MDTTVVLEDAIAGAKSAVRVARRRWPNESVDFESIANEAAWKAARSYDGRGTAAGYGYVVAMGAIIDEWRHVHGRRGQHPTNLSIDRLMSAEGDGIAFTDTLVDRSPGPDALRVSSGMLLDLCGEARLARVALLYSLGFTQEEIAEREGLTGGRISQLLTLTRRKVTASSM